MLFFFSATQRDLQPYLGLFEEEIACYIIYQVLKAIEYLHSKNILHLDIKVRESYFSSKNKLP